MKRVMDCLILCGVAAITVAQGPSLNKLVSTVDESLKARQEFLAMGKRAVPTLIQGLGSMDGVIRNQCAELLADIGPVAVPALSRAMNSGSWRTRAWAAMSLGEMNDSQAVTPLISALHDDNWWVRSQAALALGNFDDQRARDALTEVINDKDIRVQDRASFALSNGR